MQPHIKTSLAPGSRIVTEYLETAGLLTYLEKLGFYLAGYGCTTCIGNAGDLRPEFNEAITKNDLVCAAVLSGNRNFEARIHPNLKANFLASPPLVVAYAIAGTVLTDLMSEPLGKGKKGRDVYLGDIWPTSDEIHALMKYAMNGKAFKKNYEKVATDPGKLWGKVDGATGQVYDWPTSTYIAKPPFFDGFTMQPAQAAAGVVGARAMALFGDSITTDHISPAGSIKEASPAGAWLKEHKVLKADFNSYGSRRGNHDVMVRGTFANVRIKNLMIPAGADGSREEGGVDVVSAVGREAVHLRRRDEVHVRRHADGDLRRRGIRHWLVARLGGQGHRVAGHQGGGRSLVRNGFTAATWSAWACCRCSSRAATAGRRWASPVTKASTSSSRPRSSHSRMRRW